MKKFAIVLGAAILSAGLAPVVALADETTATSAVEIKRGDMLYTADGKRVGNIYRVSEAGDAQVIYRSKMITVAASTLTAAEGMLITSLTLDEVRKLA